MAPVQRIPVQRITEIDGLRAIAMTMVVAHHCGILPFGWVGVWLFFVISGYVIARNFRWSGSSDQPASTQYVEFIARRFYRIVPVYVLYVAVGTVIAILINQAASLHDLPFLATFTFNWQRIFEFWERPDWSVFGHLWTLSVEEQFYVLFPVLVLCLSRRRFLGVAVALVILGPAIRFGYSSLLAAHSSDQNWLAFAVFSASIAHFDAFLIGALLAHFEEDLRRSPALLWKMVAASAAIVAAYVLSYAAINANLGATGVGVARNVFSGVLYGQYREVFVYLAVDACAAVVVAFAALQSKLVRPLANSFLSLIGRISYGAYLYHALILWLIGAFLTAGPIEELAPTNRVIWFVVAWLVTVALAWVSYFYFELPIMRWAQRGAKTSSERVPLAGQRSATERTCA